MPPSQLSASDDAIPYLIALYTMQNYYLNAKFRRVTICDGIIKQRNGGAS